MNAVIKNTTYFIYINNKNQKIFLVKSKNNFIEEFNITNYDFSEKDFNEFVKNEKLNNSTIELLKDTYKVKTDMACYLLDYCGY